MTRIKVYIEREDKEYEIEFNGKTVKDLLEYLNLPVSEFVIMKNGEIVTEDEELKDGDYIKIIDVVSGG